MVKVRQPDRPFEGKTGSKDGKNGTHWTHA
jgi:hypothetical protein